MHPGIQAPTTLTKYLILSPPMPSNSYICTPSEEQSDRRRTAVKFSGDRRWISGGDLFRMSVLADESDWKCWVKTFKTINLLELSTAVNFSGIGSDYIRRKCIFYKSIPLRNCRWKFNLAWTDWWKGYGFYILHIYLFFICVSLWTNKVAFNVFTGINLHILVQIIFVTRFFIKIWM